MKTLFFILSFILIVSAITSDAKAVDCSTDTVGLCTPTIEEIIDETLTETIQYEADGYTVTTETITNTNTTTVSPLIRKHARLLLVHKMI